MSIAGSSYVPPVQLGAAHALAPRDQGQKKEQPKHRKPGHQDPDEVELTGESPDAPPAAPPEPAPVVAIPATPGAYSAHGPAAKPPERHIDLNG